MTNNIFITGGAGFIGSHLVGALVDKGYSVKIFDNFHRNSVKYTGLLGHPNVDCVNGDVCDANALEREMNGYDMVIHMAAIAGVSHYHKRPAQTLKVNLIGTYNLLEAMVANNINRVIDLSSSEVFGTEAIDVNEKSYFSLGPPDDKRWCYAASKIGSEQLVYRFGEEHGWNTTIVRPFNIYGPRQIGEGAISNFCKKILLGKPLRIEGDGSASRSWCYIDDFIHALLNIIVTGHEGAEIFNIGNPKEVLTNYGLGHVVINKALKSKKLSVTSTLEHVPMAYTETKVRYPNISKMQSRYKWEPTVTLFEGISKTLNWFIDHYEKD